MDNGLTTVLRQLGAQFNSRIWRLGFASRFFLAMLLHSGTSLRRLHLTIREIYFTGVLSLITSSALFQVARRRSDQCGCPLQRSDV